MKPFVETRMLGEARKAARPAHRLIIELLIFLLLMLVASMVESVVIAPCEVGIILSDESFLEAVGSGNLLSLPDVVSDLLSRLPDWFMLVQLGLPGSPPPGSSGGVLRRPCPGACPVRRGGGYLLPDRSDDPDPPEPAAGGHDPVLLCGLPGAGTQ